MADEIRPKSGGNPFLDSMVKEDPTMLRRMWEGFAMTPEKAYKHMYGEDFPQTIIPYSSARNNTRLQQETFIKLHSEGRQKLMQTAADNYLDPLYGADSGSFKDALGGGKSTRNTSAPVSPDLTPPRSASQSASQGRTAPQESSADTLQRLLPESAPKTGPWSGPQAIPNDGRSPTGITQNFNPSTGGPLTPPETPGIPSYANMSEMSGIAMGDTGQSIPPDLAPPSTAPISRGMTPGPGAPALESIDSPMNSVERALGRAEIKRRGSPYYGAMRGAYANRHAQADESLRARGLEPGSPEYMSELSIMMDPTRKQAAGEGTSEYNKNVEQTATSQARGDILRTQSAYEDQNQQDKHANVQSQIAARKKASEHVSMVHKSLIDLRAAQTESTKSKTAGTHPDQDIKQTESDRKEFQRHFVRTVIGSIDPKDLLNPAFQDALAEEMVGMLGGEQGAGNITGKQSSFHKLGTSMGLIDEAPLPKIATPNTPGTHQTPKSAAKAAPKVGDVIGGHKFKGGNPNDQNNWEKVK